MVSGLPKAPALGTLAKGEIAVNYNNADPCLFIEKDNGNLAKFSSSEVITDFVTGITSTKVDITTYNTHTADTSLHVTAADRTNWNDKYSKSEVDTEVQAIEAEINTKISDEATARQNADNLKQDKLTGTTGYTTTANRVLVSLNGAIQWSPFNNILAGTSTPISSQGNDGDIYIQTR